MGRLTAVAVRSLGNGMHGDGDGLWLSVRGPTQRSWLMRFTSPTTRKTREMGLGPYPEVSLAQAREARDAARVTVRAGQDPIEAKRAASAPPQAVNGMSFRDAMDATIAARRATWRDPTAEHTWRRTLTTYAATLLDKPCREIDTSDVLAVLEPIWTTTTTTAKRLRERIEIVITRAAVLEGWNDRANVARWRGHFDELLPKPGLVHTPTPHASLPYKDAPAFYKALRLRRGVGARLLEFAMLTGNRMRPIRKAVWGHVDVANGVWNCPADDMKADEAHTVPLTAAMLRVLESMKPLRRADAGDYVFPGNVLGKPLSHRAVTDVLDEMKVDVTIHGFRSTIRDWVGEETQHQSDVAEAVLAHVLPGGDVRKAYQRGELLAKRRRLHEDWERFLGA